MTEDESPYNKIPVNPEWAAKVDEINRIAAKDLEALVVVIAVQENGKLAVSVDGIPDKGPIHDMAQNIPRFLSYVATACAMQEEFLAQKGQET